MAFGVGWPKLAESESCWPKTYVILVYTRPHVLQLGIMATAHDECRILFKAGLLCLLDKNIKGCNNDLFVICDPFFAWF